MAITNQNVLSYAVQQWLDDVLLSRKEPGLIHGTWAMKKVLPAKSGDTIRMRRYTNLERATVPLGASGITPPSQTLSALDIDARVSWYGSYVVLTDQLTLTLQDPVLNETASLLAQSLRESQDVLIRQVLESAMCTIDCVNGANGRNVAVVKSLLMDLELLAA